MLNRIKKAWATFRRSPNISFQEWDQLLAVMELGEESSAGVRVSEQTGTRQDTVFSCINILSRDMASAPLKLYERRSNGGRAEVSTHPVSGFLKNPNSAQTAMQWRQLLWATVLASGNTYQQIFEGTDGAPQMWPVSPARIEKVFLGPDNKKRFLYKRDDGTPRTFTADELFHCYGLSFGGWKGVSPIRWCMETIGRAIAVGEYGAAYFSNPTPKAILTHPTGFANEEDRKKFVATWKEEFAGKKGLSTVAVLPNGMAVGQIVKIPNNEAQFIETQKFSKEQIAQIYQCPMHRLQALDRATFSNIEEQDLEYVKYALLPWMTALEQALEKQLFDPQDRQRFQILHNVDALLRGDFKTRMEGHSLAILSGQKTLNEVRALENMEAFEGGDELFMPLNMGRLSDIGKDLQDEPPPPGNDDDDDDSGDDTSRALNLRRGVNALEFRAASARRKLAANYRPKIERAIARLVSADARVVRKKLAEGITLTVFLSWAEDYFAERSSPTKQALEGIFAALATDAAKMAGEEIDSTPDEQRISGFSGKYSETFGGAFSQKSRVQLQQVATEAGETEFAGAVETRLVEWEEGGQGANRARKQAQRETTSLVNAIASLVFSSAGYGLVWVTFGKNCPYCNELAGKRVASGEQFVGDGEFNPAGADRPIKVRGGIKQPPLHGGCDCGVAPG